MGGAWLFDDDEEGAMGVVARAGIDFGAADGFYDEHRVRSQLATVCPQGVCRTYLLGISIGSTIPQDFEHAHPID